MYQCEMYIPYQPTCTFLIMHILCLYKMPHSFNLTFVLW